MLVPLYGFLEGDTMGLLVLAHDTWTIAEIAERLRYSARVRVDCRADLIVYRDGMRLAQSATVSQAGLQPLDCLQVRRNGTISHAAAPSRGPESVNVP